MTTIQAQVKQLTVTQTGLMMTTHRMTTNQALVALLAMMMLTQAQVTLLTATQTGLVTTQHRIPMSLA
jgi:hypothetical protein